MAQTSILVQLDPAVEARLAALSQDRDVSEVAAELLSGFVDPESFEHQRIRQGLAELDAGNSIANERVMEWLDSWGTENELPAPK
jgi:predicted transcriptional regulator